MNEQVRQEHPHGQERIWRHYQNLAPESFAAARPRLDFLVRRIARKAESPRARVLNIGIGSGYFERACRERGWSIHSLDPDTESCRRLAAEGIAAQVGTIESIPLEAAAFDFVVASEVLEHLSDAQRAAGLVEIARVLVPGGWFLGTAPYNEDLAAQQVVCPACGEVFHRWGHQASFDVAGIRGLLSRNFRVAEARRTAFVAFRGRGPSGMIKSLVRVVLARRGAMIAIPTIYFAARRVE
jgi:SAM-dependent methyltransferase